MNPPCLSAGPVNVHYGHYGQWNPEIYLPGMKYHQYRTGCAEGCSEQGLVDLWVMGIYGDLFSPGSFIGPCNTENQSMDLL